MGYFWVFMTWNTCIDYCKHQNNQDTDNFHHSSRKFCPACAHSSASCPLKNTSVFCIHSLFFSSMLDKWNHTVCHGDIMLPQNTAFGIKCNYWRRFTILRIPVTSSLSLWGWVSRELILWINHFVDVFSFWWTFDWVWSVTNKTTTNICI